MEKKKSAYPQDASGYEGLQKQTRQLKTPPLEVWENQYADKEYLIHIETREFNCLCPKTGLPDFACLVIDYAPDKYCIELKSFKEYLVFYRDIGIFHEHVVNRILDDFLKACRPRYAKITGEFNIRGGIKTTVSREYKRKGYKGK
ncbi:MAG: NADPH-dependent 7-cyano-7-deazaguanine reductase QueF [Candidatus Omnitrophica bacterium]|nr:NADPH-dependent 7-cyano-7-deazaguanine reductase QueF [Candidatus Omnitrophota bacterium]